MTNILDDVKGLVSDAMGTITDLKLYKHKIYLITRTWSGDRVGQGAFVDVGAEVLPTPYMKSYDHSFRMQSGGVVKQGDIFLKYINKKDFPLRTDVDCTTTEKNIEKFYKIEEYLYRVISIVEAYVHWDVQVRKTNL
jgi:hypothetical protein